MTRDESQPAGGASGHWGVLLACLKRLAGRLALVAVVPAATLWMVLAVAFSPLSKAGGAAVALAVIVVLAAVENRWRAVGMVIAFWVVIWVSWALIPASNERDWQTPVAVLPTATIGPDGRVTVHNLRHFDYRSRDDFDVRYEERSFDLDALQGVDFLVSYWGDEAIAHTFLSFDFGPAGGHLAVSIEIRPEEGESYHPVAGLFKQYEIIYVLGDERDLIRLRTNYRAEDTYLYRGNSTPEQARALLLDILRRVNGLAEKPAFYGTVRANCTTSLIAHVNRVLENPIPFSGRLLFNGYADKLAYDRGNIETPLPFPELKRACAISKVARALEDGPEFSQKIRAHVAGEIAARQAAVPTETRR